MIYVNSPEAWKQYKADCAADRRRERLAATVTSPPIFHFEHDTEFTGKTIYIPPQLIGMELSKSDLRLLMVSR